MFDEATTSKKVDRVAPAQRLKNVGFAKAGHWTLTKGVLEYDVSPSFDLRNVLYAFVSGDGEVLYIGKTVNRLTTRMYGYKNPGPSQSTNQKGHARIRTLLQRGLVVEIWALPDNGLLHYGGFHVNLAAGLEDSLVRELAPPWNTTGKSTTAVRNSS